MSNPQRIKGAGGFPGAGGVERVAPDSSRFILLGKQLAVVDSSSEESLPEERKASKTQQR